MGYTFKSICIKNFKYITDDKPLKFDFMNSNIVILDGQNGYGKTTLFDAIEILLTGKIKRFKPGLQNRKTETLGTLANDTKKDIVISAILSSDESEMHIERKLLCENEFKSSLMLNDQEISQEELYNKLYLSLNMFEIGTYISQSESLDFLQNKYKDRKESVSSLLDNSEIKDKIQALKSVQECILGKVEKETGEKKKQIEEVERKVAEIKQQSEHIVMNSELPGENIRLFSEAEYEFDVIKDVHFLHILHIQLYFFGHNFLDIGALRVLALGENVVFVAVNYGGQLGNTWLYSEHVLLIIGIHLHIVRHFGPGSYETHLPRKHVKQLRQLVHFGFS